MSGTRARYVFLLLALIALYAGRSLQPGLARLRGRYRLTVRPAREGVPPEYILANAALGGFRGLFITGLWIRAQNMKNDGKYYEMVDIYNLITKLQPSHHAAWAFQGWDLAYNVSVEHLDPQDRVFWVFRGVDLLRRQGIPKNPGIPDLYRELAWFFYHKMGDEMDWANPWYRKHLMEQMEDLFEDPLDGDTQTRYLAEMAALPPEREALSADPTFRATAEALAARGFDIFRDGRILFSRTQRPESVKDLLEDKTAIEQIRRARLWRIAERIRNETGMEPREMYRLASKYGPIDWRTPYAHALYWSVQSYAIWRQNGPKKPTLKYERLVRFSLIRLVQQGHIFKTPEGFPYYTPDLRLLSGVVRHLDETMDFFTEFRKDGGGSTMLTGFRSGYMNFLKDAVFKLYFDGRIASARPLLRKMADLSGDERYDIPVREFVRRNFAEWIDSPTWRDSLIFLQGNLATAYFYLAVGDTENYERHKNLAEYFYRTYCLKRWPPVRDVPDDPLHTRAVPPLLEIRKAVVMGILQGRDPRFRELLARALMYRLENREPAVTTAVRYEIQRLERTRPDAGVPMPKPE